MSALAPTYFEYWSMPEHDQEHQYRQYMAKHGLLVIHCQLRTVAKKLNDGEYYCFDLGSTVDNPLSRPIGMAGAP